MSDRVSMAGVEPAKERKFFLQETAQNNGLLVARSVIAATTGM